MRILWTLAKIIIGLAIAIPLGVVALALALGILGSLLGLAFMTLRLAVVAFVGYGVFRAARYVLAPDPKPTSHPTPELTMRDPYYEAAMRELDAEMGHTSRR